MTMWRARRRARHGRDHELLAQVLLQRGLDFGAAQSLLALAVARRRTTAHLVGLDGRLDARLDAGVGGIGAGGGGASGFSSRNGLAVSADPFPGELERRHLQQAQRLLDLRS